MRALPIALFLFGLVFGALILGTSIVENTATTIPLTLEAVFLLALTWIGVNRERDPDARRFLSRLVMAALGVRLLLFFAVHFVLSPYFFAPDAIGYENAGRAISAAWQGLAPYPDWVPATTLPSYNDLNAAVWILLGDSSIFLPILNIFAGIWAAVFTFYLARHTVGDEAGKIAAVLTAFFPSLVLWSILNIRDALSTMIVTAVVLLGVRIYRGMRPGKLMLLGAGLVVLAMLRDYMAFLVISGMVLGYAAALRPGRIVGTLFIGSALLLLISLGAQQVGLFVDVTSGDPLATAQSLREGLTVDANSGYGRGFDTTSIGGALAFLPIGLGFLLFAPFPWAINSTLQLAAMPETLLWYPLFVMALIGIRRTGIRVGTPLILIATLLVVVSSYALVEGNFGTAYRHRAQIMPLFFVFSAVGFARLRSSVRGKPRRRRMLPLTPQDAGGRVHS